MAECLAPLSATQVAWVQSPVRHTISVNKLSPVCNSLYVGTSQELQLHCIIGYKFAVVKAKVFPHLEAWVRVGRNITHRYKSF
jgi:hypothetical protein